MEKKFFIHLFILLKQNKKKIHYVQIYLEKKKHLLYFTYFILFLLSGFFFKNKRILSLPKVGDKELNNNDILLINYNLL
jgi:hypothetical protein